MESSLLNRLEKISENDFKGYDPYDGCSSRFEFLSVNRYTRLFSQYSNKFSPINLRRLFGINKQIFPQVPAYFGLTVFKMGLQDHFKDELDWAVQYFQDFAKGDPHQAIKLFEEHLSQLREVADVKTICMHGSPLSKFDNRDIWKHYNYRDYGIIAEPYFDLDFH